MMALRIKVTPRPRMDKTDFAGATVSFEAAIGERSWRTRSVMVSARQHFRY
jgi:hypothetical protein